MIQRPHTGNRGAALFVLGMILSLTGLGNIGQPPEGQAAATLAVADKLVGGFQVLLSIWIAVGLFALVAAWWRRLQVWAYPGVTMLFLYLAGTAFWAWHIVPDAHRAWYAAALYFGFAVMTWFASGWEEAPRNAS